MPDLGAVARAAAWGIQSMQGWTFRYRYHRWCWYRDHRWTTTAGAARPILIYFNPPPPPLVNIPVFANVVRRW